MVDVLAILNIIESNKNKMAEVILSEIREYCKNVLKQMEPTDENSNM